MYNAVIQLVGEALKSNLVTGIINALIANLAVPAPSEVITETVNTAAANTSVASAANAVVTAIVPGLKTWTPAELAAAEAAWAAQQDPGTVNLNSAFAGGVAWALAHQTSTLTTGIANAVAAHTDIPASVVQKVETDAVAVATAELTGGTPAAVATAVGEAVQAVEAAQDAAKRASSAAIPGTTAEPSKA